MECSCLIDSARRSVAVFVLFRWTRAFLRTNHFRVRLCKQFCTGCTNSLCRPSKKLLGTRVQMLYRHDADKRGTFLIDNTRVRKRKRFRKVVLFCGARARSREAADSGCTKNIWKRNRQMKCNSFARCAAINELLPLSLQGVYIP